MKTFAILGSNPETRQLETTNIIAATQLDAAIQYIREVGGWIKRIVELH